MYLDNILASYICLLVIYYYEWDEGRIVQWIRQHPQSSNPGFEYENKMDIFRFRI